MEREELQEMLSSFKEEILSEVKESQQSFNPPPSAPPPQPQQPLTREEALVQKIVNTMEERHRANSEALYDTMFSERVGALTRQYPAFGEYLESQDDFGETMSERIKRKPTYEERIQALETVFKNFANAQSSEASSNMRLTKAMKEQVTKDEEERDAIKEKFAKGDMSLDDFTTQFFGTVEKQLAKLRG